MEEHDAPPRRGRVPPPPRQSAGILGRLIAVGALLGVIVVLLVLVLGSGKKGQTGVSTTSATVSSTTTQATTVLARPAAVPILTYNVINTQPPGSTLAPSLYVPVAQFTAQMQALKAAGWHPITLDQLGAYWSGKAKLPVAKPIVLTFDGGYASQYNNALPVLRSLGWVGVLDVPQTLLPSSEGGLADTQVRALSSAGWEIDALSPTAPDLTTVDAATAQQQLTSERQALSSSYGAPVNWLAYSLGKYNATVSGAAKAAGFRGALTGATGWADPSRDRFTLARVVVAGGTSAQQLVAQIAADRASPAPAASSNGS